MDGKDYEGTLMSGQLIQPFQQRRRQDSFRHWHAARQSVSNNLGLVKVRCLLFLRFNVIDVATKSPSPDAYSACKAMLS